MTPTPALANPETRFIGSELDKLLVEIFAKTYIAVLTAVCRFVVFTGWMRAVLAPMYL